MRRLRPAPAGPPRRVRPGTAGRARAPEPSPQVEDAADPHVAACEEIEPRWILCPRCVRQIVLCRGQARLDFCHPVVNAVVASTIDEQGFAEVRQRLGIAFLPEGILDGKRQHDGVFEPAQQMPDPRPKPHRPFARIGELTLRRDPQGVVRLRQHGGAGSQEGHRSCRRSGVDAEEPEGRKEAVLLQGRRVDRGIVPIPVEQVRQDHAQQRVPPGRMVHHDDEGPALQRRRRAVRDSRTAWKFLPIHP